MNDKEKEIERIKGIKPDDLFLKMMIEVALDSSAPTATELLDNLDEKIQDAQVALDRILGKVQ